MEEYHSPDERWSIFGANTFEDYKKQYLVKGHFHKAVPDDLVEDFKTAEHIMAHAYYYYPMYDEAFAKVLRLIEMAVKQKCKLLDYETGKKNLKTLIDYVSTQIPAIKINERLDAVRMIRNGIMHPENHHFAGAALKGSMVALVNIINEIFLSEDYYKECEAETHRVQEAFSLYENTLLALETGDFKYLLHNFKCYTTLKTNSGWLYFCVGTPILKDLKKEIEELNVSPTLYWIIENVRLIKNTAHMKAIHSDQEIVLYKTRKSQNIETKDHFLNQINRYDKQTLLRYGEIVEHNIDVCISHFLYEHLHKNP